MTKRSLVGILIMPQDEAFVSRLVSILRTVSLRHNGLILT